MPDTRRRVTSYVDPAIYDLLQMQAKQSTPPITVSQVVHGILLRHAQTLSAERTRTADHPSDSRGGQEQS